MNRHHPTLAVGLHWLFKIAIAAYFLYLAVLTFRLNPLAPASVDAVLAVSYTIFALVVLGRPFASEVRYNWRVLALCGASILYFYLFDLHQPVSLIGAFAGNLLLAAGTIGWIASAAFIRRSFGILPARRKIRVDGPYRWIRHPMYTSYLLMDLGLLFCFPSPRNVAVALLAAALYGVRALLEERLLAQDPSYQSYCESTRFRFIPYLI